MEAHPVPAEPRTQADVPILVGHCPCGLQIAVTAPGRLVCQCGKLLDFHDKTNTTVPAK